MTLTAAQIVYEVFALGGEIVLEVGTGQPQLCLCLPKRATWLREEIKRRKPEIVAEMVTRYLSGWEPRGAKIQ